MNLWQISALTKTVAIRAQALHFWCQCLQKMNKNEIDKIQNYLLFICSTPMQFDDILANVFNEYHIRTTASQIVLIGSTIKNHLTDLYCNKKLEMICNDGRMFWKKI